LIAFFVGFLVSAIVGAAFLWVGMKVTARFVGMPSGGAYCSFKELIGVSVIAAIAGLVPYVGWVLSIVVLFFALRKVTDAGPLELIMMVAISRLAVLVVGIVVAAL
jgi:hypothetical protein